MEKIERSALVSALIAAVTALDLDGAPTVGEAVGDDRLFNKEAVFPFVAVAYEGARNARTIEEGAATTYQAEIRLALYVQTADDPDDTPQGHAQALSLLDALEEGLAGATLSPGGRLTWVADGPVDAYAGRYEFKQVWRLDPLVSR